MDCVKQLATVSKIEMTSSHNGKRELLKKLDPRILSYAYNPFIKFYLKPPPIPQTTGSITDIEGIGFRILDLLSTGKYRGNKAQKMVVDYMQNLGPSAREIYHRILLKDLQCGIGPKLINDVFPNLIPDEFCMLCQEFDPARVVYPCFISPKVDGDRGIRKHTSQEFVSRRGHRISGLGHLINALKRIPFDVDGELKDPSKSFSKGSGVLRSKGDKSGYVYYIFDIVMPVSKFAMRWELMKSIVSSLGNPLIQLVPHYVVYGLHNLNEWYDLFLRAGYEGAVIKSFGHLYQYKRSYDWMRKVPLCSADVLVIGIIEGEGQHKGMVGALDVIFKGKRQEVGPGFMSHSERIFYFKHPSSIVGKKVEVIYKEKTDAGKMRQARYKRIRYDK